MQCIETAHMGQIERAKRSRWVGGNIMDHNDQDDIVDQSDNIVDQNVQEVSALEGAHASSHDLVN